MLGVAALKHEALPVAERAAAAVGDVARASYLRKVEALPVDGLAVLAASTLGWLGFTGFTQQCYFPTRCPFTLHQRS